MAITSTTYFAVLFVLGGCLLLIRQNWFLWLPGSRQYRVQPLPTGSLDFAALIWVTLALYFLLPGVLPWLSSLVVPIQWVPRVASMLLPCILGLFLLWVFYRPLRHLDTARSFPVGSLFPLGYLWFLIGFILFLPSHLTWLNLIEKWGLKGSPQVTLVESSTTTDPLTLILITITVVVLAPLWEELFFRGLIFRFLLHRMNFWLAAALSGLLFSLIHMQINGFVGFWVLGIVFALAYRITGTIWIPVIIHAIHNLNALIISRYFTYSPKAPVPTPHDFISLLP